MAKGKYSDRMTQLGCIRPQKGMTYSFPPKHRPKVTLTCLYIYIYIYIHTHIYIHTYTHTHTHIYMVYIYLP